MERDELKKLLSDVQNGTVSIEEAEHKIRKEPYEDLGYAKPDFHRGLSQGAGEVIYGAGKTADQIVGIVESMRRNGQDSILITRIGEESAKVLLEVNPDFDYDPLCHLASLLPEEKKQIRHGCVVVAAAGTSDLYAAEEAARTAEFYGNQVTRLYDVGVAGLHRLLSHVDEIMDARAIVAAAGMEGALASVIGGLASCPVIALPTSVGYGASFGGISALLAMLNSCASGVSVVNIDNGFGAGYLAGMINHMGDVK